MDEYTSVFDSLVQQDSQYLEEPPLAASDQQKPEWSYRIDRRSNRDDLLSTNENWPAIWQASLRAHRQKYRLKEQAVYFGSGPKDIVSFLPAREGFAALRY